MARPPSVTVYKGTILSFDCATVSDWRALGNSVKKKKVEIKKMKTFSLIFLLLKFYILETRDDIWINFKICFTQKKREGPK